MTPDTLDQFSAAELAALLAFHADAGVDWLLEESPVDRFVAPRAATGEARGQAASAERARAETGGATRTAPQRGQRATPPSPTPAAGPVAIPDEQAVAEARRLAAAATSVEALSEAMRGFTGCNLKNSARSTLFAEGEPGRALMIVGPVPLADDDRDGRPFSGRSGTMLDRMLAGIGLSRDQVTLTTAIAWRPPGNRMPTPREAEICRPFIDRQIALFRPQKLLLLGNFTARLLLGSNETIHDLRGRWHRLTFDGHEVDVMATHHPQDMAATPEKKKQVWADLLALKAGPR
ncbi:DNA polymerase [Rhizobium sp. RU20A]|uniref:uracil-DNA glycosylase n=1 Tax=Rhizobium sp. RU20A TaxID=1907412 RepID=UPI00095617CC|nr:uracil-DNA glycosylase [Rhizobium sp. RU20A]SIR15109.1 DNA polymerase [Rhizobium sp. RU20A]